MSGKSRNFCFTFNNYTEKDFEALLDNFKKDGVIYYVVGEELGEKKATPHLQGTIVYKNPRAFSAIKGRFDKRIHWECCNSIHDSIKYCKKDGKWVEWGDEPKGQGKRTDLDELKVAIVGGMKVDEIVMNFPMSYHQYGRTLTKIEDIVNRQRFRVYPGTRGIWYHGPSGVGKSRKAFEGFTPETHYVYARDNGWWDGYKGQKTVIMNEFRGEIPYGQLLDLIDWCPLTVRRRNGEPVPFLADLVIITSSMQPKDVYHNLAEKDKLDQLYRRVDVIAVTRNGTEVVGGNTMPPPLMPAAPIVAIQQKILERNSDKDIVTGVLTEMCK